VEYPYVGGSKAYSAKFSPNGQYIAFGLANDSVIILKASDYSFVVNIPTKFGEVREVDFSANSDKLLVCGRNGDDGYEIYLVPGWGRVKFDYNYGDDALSCRFSNNDLYAVGSKDGYVRLYNASSSYSLAWSSRRNSDSEIAALDFSPNSSYLLATWANNNRKIGIFNVNSNIS
jgi:WD40 repeat protein